MAHLPSRQAECSAVRLAADRADQAPGHPGGENPTGPARSESVRDRRHRTDATQTRLHELPMPHELEPCPEEGKEDRLVEHVVKEAMAAEKANGAS